MADSPSEPEGGSPPAAKRYVRGRPLAQGRTKSQAAMSQHLRAFSPTRRMQMAITKVLEEGWQQAESARYHGVNPSSLNRSLQQRKREIAAQQEQAAVTRAEYAGVAVSGEIRRVPPISEFVRKYFGGFTCWDHNVRHEIPPVHDEIMQRMCDPAEKRLLVNIPPGHSKTTNGTVFTTVYEIARDPNSQTAIISAGADLAMDIVEQIGRFLTDPTVYADCESNLIADWGPFHDGSPGWTQKAFTVCGRQSVERDPTVRAFGIDSKIYGRRLHRIICDDIADVDNQTNPDNVEKMFRKVTTTLDSRVGLNGKLMILGTRVAPNDIYSMLLGLDDYTVLRHPCIIDYQAGLTLWPEHVSYDDAMRIKAGRITAEMFELIYQNSDMMTTGASFSREHLDRCHDESRVLGQLPKGIPLTLFVGVDPAGSGKQAGYTAMALLGVDRTNGMRYLVDLVNVKQMRAPQMQAQIFDWCSRYNVYSVRFESVALQTQIFDTKEYRQGLSERGARMDWHQTHGGRGAAGKQDAQWGIESMAPGFHNGMVSLPWGDRETRRKVGELEEQLMRFPMEGAPTDAMMAYWIADTGCALLTRKALPKYAHRGLGRQRVPERMARRRRIVNAATGESRPVTSRDFYTGEAKVARVANMPATVEELTRESSS